MRVVYRVLSITLGLTALAIRPGSAQFHGVPIFVSPKGGTGVTLAGKYGRGLNDESGETSALAAGVTYGVSAVTLGAGIGTYNPQVGTTGRQTEPQFMANAALRILGGALETFAVNINGGVGYVRTDTGTGDRRTNVEIPLGVGAALNVPLSGFSLEPWVAPRAQLVRTKQGSADDWRAGYGVSLGINLGVANGLGLQAAFDWSDIGSGSLLATGDLPSVKPMLLGFGLSYTLP